MRTLYINNDEYSKSPLFPPLLKGGLSGGITNVHNSQLVNLTITQMMNIDDWIRKWSLLQLQKKTLIFKELPKTASGKIQKFLLKE
jgi:acyl-CoA synthetase (AMP-forming)/AMP-acid ligase II